MPSFPQSTSKHYLPAEGHLKLKQRVHWCYANLTGSSGLKEEKEISYWSLNDW